MIRFDSLLRKLMRESRSPAAVTQRMHLHPDPVLPFTQLQGARAARYPKMPVAAAAAPSQLALAANDKAAPTALVEDLRGRELEVQLEHTDSDPDLHDNSDSLASITMDANSAGD